MVGFYLESLAAIAVALSVLMAGAWAPAARPVGGVMPHSRGERNRNYQTRTSMFFPLPPQKGAI